MCVLQVSVIFWPFSGVNIPYLTPRYPCVLGKVYEGCPVSIRSFWTSREPVAWPGCNLAASHRRPYCASFKSLSRGASQSAVRRRWLTLCIVWPSHSQWPGEQIIFKTMHLPILQLSWRFFLAKHHVTQVCQPPTAQIWLPGFSQR
jgi:hypothetical protein